MLSTLIRIVVALTYPPILSACIAALGLLAWGLQRKRLAASLLISALLWTCLWSIPMCSDWLRAPLERQHATVAMASLPQADAIVVLGGGKVRPDQPMSSRLGAAAHAWLTGRARTVVLSGGGGRNGKRHGRHRSEAERMSEAIVRVGVPRSALVLEDQSRSTEENALFTARVAKRRNIHRILLVTSSLHMPRASLLFREAGFEVVEVPVPERVADDTWAERWLPSTMALWRSGRAFKEYGGLLAARTDTVCHWLSGVCARFTLSRQHGGLIALRRPR